MAKYYANKTAKRNGDHEVHREGCSYLEQATSTQYLGEFRDCYGAVAMARRLFCQKADGCTVCSPECHR